MSIQARHFQESLCLECLVPPLQEEWDIRTSDTNRPGMQFCGYYAYFAYERPQIIGKVEMSYLEDLPPEDRCRILNRYFSYDIPCVVICRGMDAPAELLRIAREKRIPVYRSAEVTSKLAARMIHYLNRQLAPHVTRHGVLLDVYGVGVMLSGKSGVGKSEAALELIKRGHQLVADDVVDICRVADNRLIGTCPERIRHLMEIRGIGIIDIRAMYGISAVTISKTIDLILELEAWDDTRTYDRVGLQEDTLDILGVPVAHQMMPVRPGRNLAIIVEVAARNLSLKRMGYNAAVALNSRTQPDWNPRAPQAEEDPEDR